MTNKLTTKGGIKRLELIKGEFQNFSLYVMIGRLVQQALYIFQNYPFQRIIIHENFNLPFVTYKGTFQNWSLKYCDQTANPEVIQGEVTAVLNSCMDEIGGSYGIKLKYPPCNAAIFLCLPC